MRTISPEAFDTLHKNGQAIDLIDVRTPAEFREVHAVPARNVSLDTLNPATLMASRR